MGTDLSDAQWQRSNPCYRRRSQPGHPERMTGKMEPVGDQKLEIEDLVMDGD
jgi:hypothetical protein